MMDTIYRFSFSYVGGFFRFILAYAKWCEDKSATEREMLMLAVTPVALVSAGLYGLPDWLGRAAVLLSLTPFFVVLLVVVINGVRDT